MNIENKRIVVTGASSGIGLELVKSLSAIAGTKIIATGRKTENIPVLPNVSVFKADVANKAEVKALFTFALEKLGGIDIFIANAGYGYYGKFGHESWEKIQDMFTTNVTSPLYSLSQMIELNLKNEFSVVITCSGIGQLPYPGMALYAGSKFALDGFSTAIQYEMPANGNLILIYPVATYTGFFDKAQMKKEQIPWPRQQVTTVVKSIIKGIRKNKKRVYPYRLFPVIIYLTNVLPFVRTIFLNTVASKLTGRK
ncbi:MAG: short-chain dehydrogenase [Bacteroidetes bacterium]|nr:short-chain dehydrogenase [Bacteroidota bacterium]